MLAGTKQPADDLDELWGRIGERMTAMGKPAAALLQTLEELPSSLPELPQRVSAFAFTIRQFSEDCKAFQDAAERAVASLEAAQRQSMN